MAAQGVSMAVSLREGKFQPSMKFKPEVSWKMAQTNWRAGIDRPVYETTMQAGNKDIFGDQPKRYEPTKSSKTKNSSDKGAIQGGYTYNPQEHFKTVVRSEMTNSIRSGGYEKSVPTVTRLTASQTNFSLGQFNNDFKSTSHALQLSHPNHRGHNPEQPQVGGWNRKNGEYHQEIDSIRTVIRGGGGAGGVLQMNFDILNGEDRPNVRENNAKRFGPRVSENIREKSEGTALHGFGHKEQKVDILSGKFVPKKLAPPRQTEASLKREDAPVLRTRPW